MPARFQRTGEGQRQHGIVLATQKEVRRRAMQGISQEEYVTVVRVLQRIVSNLEARDADAGDARRQARRPAAALHQIPGQSRASDGYRTLLPDHG